MLPMAIKQALALYVGQCFDFPTHALPQPYTAVGMPTMANEQSTYLDVFGVPRLLFWFMEINNSISLTGKLLCL